MGKIRVVLLVTVCILMIIAGCRKSQDQSTTATSDRLWKVYEDTIKGTWTWHHTYLLVAGIDSTLTVYADTMMSINPGSDSSILLGSDHLTYSDSFHYAKGPYGGPVDTGNFVHYWEPEQYYFEAGIPKDLLLNRNNDSLYYKINHTGTALGSQQYEFYTTKIFH